MILILLLLELGVLFVLSQRLTQTVFSALLKGSGSHRWALILTTLLLFPGTVIHELAHLFVAEVLGVRTGKLTLVPEYLEETPGQVRSGSVAIAKTDPIRRSLIGLSPIFVGLAALTGISYYFQQWNHETITTVVLFYLLFAISNTMFSSREDMKGVIPVLLTLGLFATAAYVAGVRIGLTGHAEIIIGRVLSSLSQSLGLVLAVNIVLLLLLKFLIAVVRKL